MNYNLKFLELYRTYETVLRSQNLDYKTIEDTSDDITQNRLRICRQLRNYLSHNNDNKFIAISETQINFLQKLITKQQTKDDTLKKHIKSLKVSTCYSTDKCADVLVKMTKLQTTIFPVLNKDNTLAGMISIFEISKLIAESKASKIDRIRKLFPVNMVLPLDTKMDVVIDSGENIICCTDTGDKKGIMLGVFIC